MLPASGASWRLCVRGGGGHDLLTLSPVLELGGVAAAPIGLVGWVGLGRVGVGLGWVCACRCEALPWPPSTCLAAAPSAPLAPALCTPLAPTP